VKTPLKSDLRTKKMGSWHGERTQAPVAEMSQGEGLCSDGTQQLTAAQRDLGSKN